MAAQLAALSREQKARKLGPAALLAVADRAYAIANTQGIADEQELEDVQVCAAACTCALRGVGVRERVRCM